MATELVFWSFYQLCMHIMSLCYAGWCSTLCQAADEKKSYQCLPDLTFHSILWTGRTVRCVDSFFRFFIDVCFQNESLFDKNNFFPRNRRSRLAHWMFLQFHLSRVSLHFSLNVSIIDQLYKSDWTDEFNFLQIRKFFYSRYCISETLRRPHWKSLRWRAVRWLKFS